MRKEFVMKNPIAIVGSLGLGLLTLGATGCQSNQQPPAQNASVSSNTATEQPNTPDNGAALQAGSTNDLNSGAMQQGENSGDINTTSQIRRRLMDASLSTDAQNITVTTLNGHVTLIGRVDSQSEKDYIGRIAAEIAQPKNVVNELFVQQGE
jgi:osmotically-inducible protein OsmY